MPVAARTPATRNSPLIRVVEQADTGGKSSNECQPLRILIVDDDVGDAMLTRNALLIANPKANVEVIGNFDKALAVVPQGNYYAALIDYRLGASDGLNLIELCRAAGSRIPLILLTGQGGLEVDLDAVRRGASDYLCKDELTPALLERAIRYASDREVIAAELRLSQRRYEAAVLGSNAGIWDWDLQTDQIYLSVRFKAMLGFNDEMLPSTRESWLARVHPHDRENLEAAIADHLGGRSETLAMEYQIQHRDGTWMWVFVRGLAQCDAAGVPERLAGSQSDITARKLAEERIRHQALHDPLTGLPNRTLLFDRLEHALHRLRRESGYGFSVLYLDLDGFKAVNDTHGHNAGDATLIEVAARLRRAVRSVDCVARLGGDEFVVLLDRCIREEDAQSVAQHIDGLLSMPFELQHNGTATLGASVGIRVVTDAGSPPEELLKEGDRSMYEVKLTRKREDAERLSPRPSGPCRSLETDLREALANGHVHAHFQPIVGALSRKTVGHEALARWSHPQRGSVSPLEFVSAAEQAGLAEVLGRSMMRQACRWTVQHGGDISVSVNISPTHVSSPDFAMDVRNALGESGLSPQRLRLELTEHVHLSVDEDVVTALEALSAIGVCIDLDDFGTGYSAIELLIKLPVAAIKIDRSLISSLDTSTKKLAILRHLVDLAHSLNVTVTAEGVETEDELMAARGQRVDCLQGYLFGHPSARPQPIH